MSTPASHADVWVIHEHHAVLLKYAVTQHWQEQLRMPIEQFMGSATGLSSLSRRDTVVLINLPQEQEPFESKELTSAVWAGVQDSPLRVTQCPATPDIEQLAHNIGLMGTKPEFVRSRDPIHCVHATRLMKMSQAEASHLKKWVELERTAPGTRRNQLQLLARLITKPGRTHQQRRLTILLSVACTAMLVQWVTQQQFAQQYVQIAPKPAQTQHVASSNNNTEWSAWRTQLQKINTGKKANLLELQWAWYPNGLIHTQATFDKPRKRVPKGCELATPLIAHCSTKGLGDTSPSTRGARK